jgi:hypothetical protein
LLLGGVVVHVINVASPLTGDQVVSLPQRRHVVWGGGPYTPHFVHRLISSLASAAASKNAAEESSRCTGGTDIMSPMFGCVVGD